MKKLTKIMLSVAAASAVAIAMGVTAMAEDTITGTYDNDTGVVTMNNVIGSGASQTIIVYDSAAETITSTDIAYINQIDNQTGPDGHFSTFTLAAGLKPTGTEQAVTYKIKIGGTDKSVQTGTLTIAGDAPATVTIVIGDVTSDGKINMADVTQVGRIAKGKARTMGNAGDSVEVLAENPSGN